MYEKQTILHFKCFRRIEEKSSETLKKMYEKQTILHNKYFRMIQKKISEFLKKRNV